MPDPALLAAFVVAVALLVLTTGPDMLFAMAVGPSAARPSEWPPRWARSCCSTQRSCRSSSTRRGGNVTTQLLVLGAAFVVIDLLIDGPTGLLAGRLGALLAERCRAVRRLHIATGSIFIGLSARLALSR